MPSPVAMLRRQGPERPTFDPSDLELPRFDLRRLEMPNVDLTKVEMPKVDLSKVDVPRAVAGAAVAAGLAKRPRSRWPFALGAIVVLTATTLAILNAEMIRDRIRQARRWITDGTGGADAGLQGGEAVAFTAAETMPIEQPAVEAVPSSSAPEAVPSSSAPDYPERFGTSPESASANGRSKVTSSR